MTRIPNTSRRSLLGTVTIDLKIQGLLTCEKAVNKTAVKQVIIASYYIENQPTVTMYSLYFGWIKFGVLAGRRSIYISDELNFVSCLVDLSLLLG